MGQYTNRNLALLPIFRYDVFNKEAIQWEESRARWKSPWNALKR
jgi:hypothetical protein